VYKHSTQHIAVFIIMIVIIEISLTIPLSILAHKAGIEICVKITAPLQRSVLMDEEQEHLLE